MISQVSTRDNAGVPGLGTDFPVLATRLLQEKAQAEGTSIALIFVDARQAFYAIIRKLVLNVIETHHAVVSLLEQLKIPQQPWMNYRQFSPKAWQWKRVPCRMSS